MGWLRSRLLPQQFAADTEVTSIQDPIWDTFGLFERLLAEFGELVRHAERIRSSGPPISPELRAAIGGFLLFSPPQAWGREQTEVITERVSGELSLPSLMEWHQEEAAARAVQLFSCVALGALLGKYAAGEIDDRGFLLGDAHLPGFIAMNDSPIEEKYRELSSHGATEGPW